MFQNLFGRKKKPSSGASTSGKGGGGEASGNSGKQTMEKLREVSEKKVNECIMLFSRWKRKHCACLSWLIGKVLGGQTLELLGKKEQNLQKQRQEQINKAKAYRQKNDLSRAKQVRHRNPFSILCLFAIQSRLERDISGRAVHETR